MNRTSYNGLAGAIAASLAMSSAMTSQGCREKINPKFCDHTTPAYTVAAPPPGLLFRSESLPTPGSDGNLVKDVGGFVALRTSGSRQQRRPENGYWKKVRLRRPSPITRGFFFCQRPGPYLPTFGKTDARNSWGKAYEVCPRMEAAVLAGCLEGLCR